MELWQQHECYGANNAKTWLTPDGKEFWLIFSGDGPERFTWIEYCPYCGFRPPDLKEGWNLRNKSSACNG